MAAAGSHWGAVCLWVEFRAEWPVGSLRNGRVDRVSLGSDRG
jgi:hypothetical protein